VIYAEATEALRRLVEQTGIPAGETMAGRAASITIPVEPRRDRRGLAHSPQPAGARRRPGDRHRHALQRFHHRFQDAFQHPGRALH